ncbi:hypothetical protein [Actinomadura miaoliensis]|uniref:Uncharacterized protein n=1 Tax=Actinomadura miaoliensis TaxID=430685 RepID=A0ABP7W4D6_9ACTN
MIGEALPTSGAPRRGRRHPQPPHAAALAAGLRAVSGGTTAAIGAMRGEMIQNDRCRSPRVQVGASPYPAGFNGSHLTLHDRHVAEFTAAPVRHPNPRAKR